MYSNRVTECSPATGQITIGPSDQELTSSKGAAGGDEIVNEHHPLTALDGIDMHFDGIRAILQIVCRLVRLACASTKVLKQERVSDESVVRVAADIQGMDSCCGSSVGRGAQHPSHHDQHMI